MTLCALKLNLTQFKIITLHLLLGIQMGGKPILNYNINFILS